MQNRTQEDGDNIFDSDDRQYDFGYDGCAGQNPAMHIVGGGGEYFDLGLYVYKNMV